MPESKGGGSRIIVLDALRGLAAVGVAYFYHWVWVFGSADRANLSLFPGAGFELMGWLYSYGYLLVELFFVISGFIFVYVYLEKIKTNKIDALSFMKLRVARLWPLVAFSSVLVVILQLYRLLFGYEVFYPEIPFNLSDLFLSLGFMQSGIFNDHMALNAPLWSVCVEMVMYVLFFYAAWLSRRWKLSFKILCIGLIILGIAIPRIGGNFLLFNSHIARALIGFFSGALLYFINERLQTSKLVQGFNKYILMSMLVLSLILFWLLWSSVDLAAFGNYSMVYSMFVFPVTILICLNSKILTSISELRPFRLLGDMSYAIYVMSFPVVLLISTVIDSLGIKADFYSKKVFLFYMLVSLGISYLVHKRLEKPSQLAMKKALKV